MPAKVYVTPRSLQWMIFSPGRRAVELESSRPRAIERAKVLARASGGGTVIVARRDGSTESEVRCATFKES
jgi:hypothetical protein